METRRVSEGYTDACFSLAYASGFQKCACFSLAYASGFQKCATTKRVSAGYTDAGLLADASGFPGFANLPRVVVGLLKPLPIANGVIDPHSNSNLDFSRHFACLVLLVHPIQLADRR